MIWWGYFCIRAEKGYENMAIIKTAILQTHVYEEKSRNITQAAEILVRPELQGIDLAVLPEMFCCPYENKYFPESIYSRRDSRTFRAGLPGRFPEVPGGQEFLLPG